MRTYDTLGVIPEKQAEKWTDDDLYEFCRANRDLNIERTAEGVIIIREPTGGYAGNRNATLTGNLYIWNRQTKLGVLFDSSTGFRLNQKSMRAPDAAWIPNEKWNQLTEDQQQKFAPICPDFVVELRSQTDSVAELQRKMEEYIANGAHLGWLIDPLEKQVYLYRPEQEMEVHPDWQQALSGEEVLPGFELDLQVLE